MKARRWKPTSTPFTKTANTASGWARATKGCSTPTPTALPSPPHPRKKPSPCPPPWWKKPGRGKDTAGASTDGATTTYIPTAGDGSGQARPTGCASSCPGRTRRATITRKTGWATISSMPLQRTNGAGYGCPPAMASRAFSCKAIPTRSNSQPIAGKTVH